jgi:hypothetical protein
MIVWLLDLKTIDIDDELMVAQLLQDVTDETTNEEGKFMILACLLCLHQLMSLLSVEVRGF